MDAKTFDALPIPAMEFAPCYNEQGEIIDFEFLWANTLATSHLLQSGQTMEGLKLLTLYPHAEGSKFFNEYAKTILEQTNSEFTYEAHPESPYSGKVMKFHTRPTEKGCLAVLCDVTEVIAERSLVHERFVMLEAACTDAITGVAIANTNHELVYANPAFCRMLKYSEDEILDLKVGDLLHPDELNKRYSEAEQLMSGEIKQYITDRVYVTKDGEPIQMSVAVSHAVSADNEHLVVAQFRDVGKERQAQADLRVALERAEESTRLKSEFLANMSHEIRTPLNGVIGMAQVLAHSELSDEQTEHVSVIRESSRNLMSLLNDILDLSKVEAGKISISPVEADLRHKLNRVFQLNQPAAEEKGLDFKVVCSPNIPSRLLFDPVRVRQCVVNLVSNAIKFTSEGRVFVVAKSEQIGHEHEITIHVSDSGIGIPAEQLKNIFEAFQQADGSTTRNYGGSGLGLTITRNLARQMGGDLFVASEAGRGSVFTLKFRAGAVQELALPDNAAPIRPPATAGQPKTLSGKSLLVVDDNLINRQVAKTILEIYGFKVETANDGVEAVEITKERRFDLILMDIHMPRMDGVRAVQEIQLSNPVNAGTPIIALTADAMSGDREKYLAQNMQGYVSKPINERELMTEIGRVLADSGAMLDVAS